MGVQGHPVAASEGPIGVVHDDLTETNASLDTLNATQTDALTKLGALQTLLGGTGSLGLTSATVTALQNAFTTSLATNHTDLTTIASDLADIHAELITKFESGDLVGMSQATLDGIGTAIATLFHYPTDYPSAGANTKLDTLHTDLGTDTGTPPSSGTGVRGWLRGIYDKVSALPTTTPQTNALTDTQLRASAVPVSGTFYQSTQPVSATALTDGTQVTKITNGTQIADTVAGESGQNMLLTGVARKELTFSTASTGALLSGDYSAYSYAVIHVTSGASYTATFQMSNDNSNWVGAQNWYLGNNTSIPAIVGANSTTGVFVVPLVSRYFRINATAVGATFAGTVEFWSGKTIPPMLLAVTGAASGNINTNAIQSGTWTVVSGGPPPTTSLNAVAATGAGTAVNVGAMSKSQTLQVTVGGSGALSALTVLLEGSLDGANWVTLATNTATAVGTTNVYSVNQPVSRIRANCTVRTASSGTPTITAIVGAAT